MTVIRYDGIVVATSAYLCIV